MHKPHQISCMSELSTEEDLSVEPHMPSHCKLRHQKTTTKLCRQASVSSPNSNSQTTWAYEYYTSRTRQVLQKLHLAKQILRKYTSTVLLYGCEHGSAAASDER